MHDLCLRELAEIIGGKLILGAMPPLGGALEPVGRLTIRSREVSAGDLFWGLCGPEGDGSRFAEEAFVLGASGCVVAGRHVEPWGGKYTIQVDDTRWALWQLAKARRTSFAGTMIGVAGGPGKSLARAMIDTVLKTNRSGTTGPHADCDAATSIALALAALKPSDDYCVLELAAQSRGDLSALAHLCRPEIAVGLEAEHECQAVAANACPADETCDELLAELPGEALAILPSDDPAWRRRAAKWRVKTVWIGRDSAGDLIASDVHYGDGKLSFRIEGERVQLPVWGRHQLRPALAAYAVGREQGLAPREIAVSLAGFAPLPGRCQVIQAGEITVIDDTSQAQPAAFRAALELLRDVSATGRRVVVCGELDMVASANGQAGQQTEAEGYEQLGRETVTQGGADLVLGCGRGAESLIRGAPEAGLAGKQTIACRDVAELESVLEQQVARGDVVLVKGSRKLPLERVVQYLQQRGPKRAA